MALFGEVANVLAVDPKLPVKTAKEYVEYCKKQGDNKVSFGSPAIGGTGHLAMEYFELLAGFKVEHVVYRGSALVLKDLLAGNIPSTMDNLPPYLPHIQSGALRALGVSSASAGSRCPTCRPSPSRASPASMPRRGGTWRRPPARRRRS